MGEVFCADCGTFYPRNTRHDCPAKREASSPRRYRLDEVPWDALRDKLRRLNGD